MKINVKPKNTDKSIYFKDGGYCFLKNDNYTIAIPVIDLRKKNKTGHIHLDVGSVNVSYKGKPFVVDPGSYTYTRDITIRKKYIDYFKHNVPAIKYENMHGISLPGFFGTEMENRFTVLRHTESNITFKHTYFNGFISRIIVVVTNEIHITDSAEKPLLSYFHIHPDVVVSYEEGNNYLCLITGDTELFFQSSGNIHVEKYDYSKGYGKIRPALKIIAESDGIIESKFKIH